MVVVAFWQRSIFVSIDSGFGGVFYGQDLTRNYGVDDDGSDGSGGDNTGVSINNMPERME